jgi:hypothetical protein
MEYKCKICIKNYKTYQTLWKHNKLFHNNENSEKTSIDYNMTSTTTILTSENSNVNNKFICQYCNSSFSRKNNMNYHIKNKCKNKNNIDEENKLLKESIKTLTFNMEEMKKQLLTVINDKCKIHPKTLNKINKQINNTNNNTNSNNTNNTNNGTVNNYIISLGKENLAEVLSKKEKINILNNRSLVLENLVQYIHFNNEKYPQFKNILITNLRSTSAFTFDDKTNQFIAIDKDELLNDIISERTDDIIGFFEEYENEINDKTKSLIEKFIKDIDNDKYKNLKKNKIKLIMYNNRNKISKEIERNLEVIV